MGGTSDDGRLGALEALFAQKFLDVALQVADLNDDYAYFARVCYYVYGVALKSSKRIYLTKLQLQTSK